MLTTIVGVASCWLEVTRTRSYVEISQLLTDVLKARPAVATASWKNLQHTQLSNFIVPFEAWYLQVSPSSQLAHTVLYFDNRAV